MRGETRKLFAQVETALERDDSESLKTLLPEMHPADIAEVLDALDDEERLSVFRLLDDELAGEVLDECAEGTRAVLVEQTRNEDLSEIVETMPPDDAADILAEMPERRAEQVLGLMDREEAEEAKELLRHPDDTAGGIMTSALVAVEENKTVGEAFDQIRESASEEAVFYVFVVDPERRLVGEVELSKLVIARPETPIRQITNIDVISVTVDADQEKVARLLTRYDLVAIPVVDHAGKLVGRVTFDDVAEVLEEEATEDAYKQAGTADEELMSSSPLHVARVRLPWLLVCLGGTTVSALVVHAFQATYGEVLVLTSFIPMIMAMGGNAGLQSTAVTVRGLATGHLIASRIAATLGREVRTGAAIGVICGLIAMVGALVFSGNPVLGLVVGLSIFWAIFVAATLGVLIPFFFIRVKIDPAVASGPLITTLNDCTGVAIYLALATALLQYLR
jgi:magnesium transporter